MSQHIELDPKREGNMIRYRVVDDATGHEVSSHHVDGTAFITEARKRSVGLATVLATHHGVRAEEVPAQVAPVEAGQTTTVPDHWHPQFNELPEHSHGAYAIADHAHALDPAVGDLQRAIQSIVKEHRDNVQRIDSAAAGHSHAIPDMGFNALREELAALQGGVTAMRDRPMQTHAHVEYATLTELAETEARLMNLLAELQRQLNGTQSAVSESSHRLAERLDAIEAQPEAATADEVQTLRLSVASLIAGRSEPSQAPDADLLTLIQDGHEWHSRGRKEAHGMQKRIWVCECGAALLLPERVKP